ncbi:hypothetical protein K2X96_00375 [Patescibacteria group bacterium]|nr:hypothetical protein [Patescibacteria group bacterium]
MITDIVTGDITSSENPADIVIGMNSRLQDVVGIGRPFIERITAANPVNLGSVLSFKFDDRRLLHMIICHHLGSGGWVGADMHVRFGMDYLWQQPESHARKHSIVQIGTGRVGRRDGANAASIHTAMTTSFLPVTLFIFNQREAEAAVERLRVRPSLVPLRMWHPERGEMELAA